MRELYKAARILGPERPAWFVRVGHRVLDRMRVRLVKMRILAPKQIYISARDDIITGGTAEATITWAPEDDMNVEERLVRHRARLDHLDLTVKDLQGATKAENEELTRTIEEQAAEFRNEVDRMTDRLAKAAGLDRLRIRWWAAIGLLIGIVLVTWSGGIASL